MKNYLFIIVFFGFNNLFNIYAQISKLHDFAGSPDGKNPRADMISDGIFLYGTTRDGGTNNLGTIFRIKPDGTEYLKLLDFTGLSNGSNPAASLFYDGTYLYGTTEYGGINNMGTIFKIFPNGNNYFKLLDFDDVVNGSRPLCSLIADGSFLYGLTRNGGVNNSGTIFKIMTDGSSYIKLHDNVSSQNGEPRGSLILEGNFLFGMTFHGGANDSGAIFKIGVDGSNFQNIFEFDGVLDGRYAFGSLISDGTFLYGVTYSGGISNAGTIFKIGFDGSGFAKLFDFDGTITGGNAYGSLVFHGGFLCGMTAYGGVNNMGIIFKIKPDGTDFNKLLDFSGSTNGANPGGSLLSDGNFLYGTTSNGGTNDEGTIFKYGLLADLKENDKKASVSIYPNPLSSGILHIDSDEELLKIKITNTKGQVVYHDYLQKKSSDIDLNTNSKGIYIYTLYSDEKIVDNGKILIE